MKVTTRVALLLASLCSFTSAALGQANSVPVQQQAAPPSFTCRTSFGPVFGMPAAGAVAPYSAVRESSSIQTLADGTHITRTLRTEKIYRDAQGRTRTERAFCEGPDRTPEATFIEIRDPVAGYLYILDEQNQVAHRFASQVRHPGESAVRAGNLVPAPEAQSAVLSNQQSARSTVTTESLGSQTMEGIMVEGRKVTRVIPEGALGNDRPITIVTEKWTSPDLKVTVLSKTEDPRMGEMTTRLTNIDVSNPSLSLFQPPPGYQVVDETERITLTYTRP